MAKKMKPKKCCYMERECTQECVAYIMGELSKTGKEIGLKDMHCIRILFDLAGLMEMARPEIFKEDFQHEEE